MKKITNTMLRRYFQNHRTKFIKSDVYYSEDRWTRKDTKITFGILTPVCMFLLYAFTHDFSNDSDNPYS
jgi:hypothetical protein